MVKDKDIGSMVIIMIFGFATALAFLYQSRLIGTIAILAFFLYAPYRALFIMIIKPYMIYRKWHTQILRRRNDKGIEISLGPNAFRDHFPNDTTDQYERVLLLLLKHKEELGIIVNPHDPLGSIYYMGN